jgi:hypothetical protein
MTTGLIKSSNTSEEQKERLFGTPRSGRTTRMLEAAVDEVMQGVRVCILGCTWDHYSTLKYMFHIELRSRCQEDDRFQHLVSLATFLPYEVAHPEILYIRPNRHLLGAKIFIDHAVMQLYAERSMLVLHKGDS